MIKYYVRTTGERVLDDSFTQIQYEFLYDKEHLKGSILAEQLLSIKDSDVVLLEDDIILCKDFDAKIKSIIEHHKNDIINFFTAPYKWFESQYFSSFSYNQCTYIPKDLIVPMAERIAEICPVLQREWGRPPSAEPLFQRAIKQLGLKVYTPRPCLVQHIDDGSLLNHYKLGRRRSPYFIDYLSQLNITYQEAKSIENREKLRKLMKEQFYLIDQKMDYSKEVDIHSMNNKKEEQTVLIVGYGTVGHNLHKEFSVLNCDIYDKYKTENNTKQNIKYDFCFICVDTPYSKAIPCDISQVENALQENEAEIYIIKSTILPTTTTQLQKKYNKKIVFSPEYYGGTQHCNNFDFNFTILGGNKRDCIQVQQLLQKVYDARHVFRLVDSTTAELAKYMENCYLGTKVAFCNQFYNIANSYGIDYEDVRELFILDERINPSHTFVYREHPYYQSHCLDKDIPAIAYSADCNTNLLQGVINYNEQCKEQK